MPMKPSTIVKHSLVLHGQKTSVSLEPEFWAQLQKIADDRGITLSALVGGIDSARKTANLSSTLRVFVLQECRG